MSDDPDSCIDDDTGHPIGCRCEYHDEDRAMDARRDQRFED